MEEVGHIPEDALCEVCGSTGFKELLCKCCECSDSTEHVYCMRKNLLCLPDAWTCDGCLLINNSSYEPLYVSDAEKDDVPNFDEQRESIQKPFYCDVAIDSHLDDLQKKLLTEASTDGYCYSILEGQGALAAFKASGNIHLDAQSKTVPLEDSVMAYVDAKPEAQWKMLSLQASGNSETDLHSNLKNGSTDDSENVSHFRTHAKKLPVQLRASFFGYNSSDASVSSNSNSHLMELGKITTPTASGSGRTTEYNNSLERGKEFPLNASDVTNNEPHSENQGQTARPKTPLGVTISGPYQAEQDTKITPKVLNDRYTQPLCNSVEALTNMRVQFKTERERIDNIDSKILCLKQLIASSRSEASYVIYDEHDSKM